MPWRRLVLLYLDDPAATFERLCRLVKREDSSSSGWTSRRRDRCRSSPLYETARLWIAEMFRRGEVVLDMGSRLFRHSVALACGAEAPPARAD